MRLLCPQCHGEVTVRQFPAVVGKTLCASCLELHRHPKKASPARLPDLRNPPRGAWFIEFPNGFELGASMGAPMMLLLVPFACFWIAGSVGLFFKSLAAPSGIDLWLRGCALALAAGIVYFTGLGIFSLWGRVVVRRRGDAGEVFSGIGTMGYRRRFNWSQVQSMKIYKRFGVFGCDQIALQGTRTLRFGSRLGARELSFVLGALRQFDRKRHPGRDVVIALPTQRRRAVALF